MRPKSIDLKLMQGTHKPSREPKSEALDVLEATPRPPTYLSPGGAEEWRRVAPEAVRVGVTRADLRALAMLCETLATESDLRAVIEREGTTIEAGSGGRKSHPALAALAQARHQAHALLSDFGLLPRGRQSLPKKAPPASQNKFAHIGRKPTP